MNKGFNIKGIENTIGSLILNNPQGKNNLPYVLFCLDLENKHNRIDKPSVQPHPPIVVKSKNVTLIHCNPQREDNT